MDKLQWFILAILAIAALSHVHVRHSRIKLIRMLQEEGKSADEISKIMKAYKED